MTSTLLQPVQWVRRACRSMTEQMNLFRQKRGYADRFGRGLVYTIDPRDEMYLFLRQLSPDQPEAKYIRDYLGGGEGILTALEDVLADVGRGLEQVNRFLEFAAGYGRFTRFLVRKLAPDRVTVSDIDPAAVDFSRRTFGVNGFYSVAQAGQLVHDRRYDVIFVVSLFSHLALPHWITWLRKLYGLLSEEGVLIFTTHGTHCYDSCSDEYKKLLRPKDEGFLFCPINETPGRLAEDYYGDCYVTDDFVRRVLTTHRLGKVVGYYPRRLLNYQDIYAIVRAPAPAAPNGA